MSAKALMPPRAWAPLVLFLILPLISLGFQIAAKAAAADLAGTGFGLDWLARAAHSPGMLAMLILEATAFVAWMKVLAEMPLSAAFPLSAISYVLIIAASVLLFHERLAALQVVGGACILAGVLTIGRSRAAHDGARAGKTGP